MMVSAGGEKRRGVADARRKLQAKHAGVEAQGSAQVGNFQMHVPNADVGVRDEGLRSGFVRIHCLHHKSKLAAFAKPTNCVGLYSAPSTL